MDSSEGREDGIMRGGMEAEETVTEAGSEGSKVNLVPFFSPQNIPQG